MKCVVIALLLCAQLQLLHGGCFYFMAIKPGMTHCQDFVDKTWHPIGSEWRNSACQVCSCEQCCNAYVTPRKIPDDCMMEFDQTECKYKVFKKNDRTQSCPVLAGVL
ncbi:hypothetical protein MATL_G00059550 [Megalops atlanticus]|uniref:Beta-microseminoprotein n=1 Tax=Megalops atlanticus TaxID=7932 RepID=A0A9D3QCA5_MEGAT|nr:hypothetical protein MATL_G00059550 [Megalops atlanticus]